MRPFFKVKLQGPVIGAVGIDRLIRLPGKRFYRVRADLVALGVDFKPAVRFLVRIYLIVKEAGIGQGVGARMGQLAVNRQLHLDVVSLKLNPGVNQRHIVQAAFRHVNLPGQLALLGVPEHDVVLALVAPDLHPGAFVADEVGRIDGNFAGGARRILVLENIVIVARRIGA